MATKTKNLMMRVDQLTYDNIKTVAKFNRMSMVELLNLVFQNKTNMIMNYSKKIDNIVLKKYEQILSDFRNDLSLWENY